MMPTDLGQPILTPPLHATHITATDDDHYVISWAGICKPHLVRIYLFEGQPYTDAAGLIPYDGSEGPVMEGEEAESILTSAIYDGPCCPTFESRATGYHRVTCCYLSNSLHCARRGGCTATYQHPPRVKSGKQTPPVKSDETLTTLRRLGRILNTYSIERQWTRISESGVYESKYSGALVSVTIQAAPGRVRLTVGGPWMPVPKRHITQGERRALQVAWNDGIDEQSKARCDAKEALREAYGNNRWQRHLLECAKSSRELLPRYNPSDDAEQIARVTQRAATLEAFAKVVDCELSMRYAINVAYAYDTEESLSHLDWHVEESLKWTAP